jgi:flagellar M-ring protein FliF
MEYIPLDEADISALTSLASRSIGLDTKRGDQISVQNLQFERTGVQEADGVSKALSFTETYIMPFSGLFKYLFVLILLLVLYKKVIAPFAEKMLEVSKEDEELEAPTIDFEDDESEDLVEKVQQMRKKVEEQLGMTGTLDEDELKHEVILEKVKTMAEDTPEEVAALLQALLTEEAEIPNTKEKG